MGALKFLKTRSYHTDPGTIVQACLDEEYGGYSKKQLIEKIMEMSGDEFRLFCNDIRILQNFYDTNQGSWVTDDMSQIPPEYRALFYMLR